MELRHLRYFVLVAEELHFGRAARRAGIAQPPLSQQIRALESELGVQLFDRNRRRVELTDAGRALVPEARETLRRAERAAQVARDGARGAYGRLAIGFVGSVAFGFLPEFISQYRKHYPGVRLDLWEMTSEQQRSALHEGTIDLGLVRYPVLDSEISFAPLFTEPLVVAISAEHDLGRETDPVPVAALAVERFVMFPRRYGPPFFDQVMSLCHDSGFSPDIVQEAIQMPTIVSLVSAGIGVAIVPGSVRHMGLRGVTYRSLQDAEGSTPETSVYAIRSAGSASVVLDQAVGFAESLAAHVTGHANTID
jgi:DNA-binding transcriptional LysR family regulator